MLNKGKLSDGGELSSKLNYFGMERAVRKLAIDEKMAPIEEIAIMSKLEVCELILKSYSIVYDTGCGNVGLVRKENMPEYNRLVKIISRQQKTICEGGMI